MKTLFITSIGERLHKIKAVGIVIFMFLISGNAYSQDPGGSPDGPPPAVPFDDSFHYVLIFIGIVMGLFILNKMQRKTAVQ